MTITIKSKNSCEKQHKKFNLRRYFTVFSIGLILILTLSLSLIFAMRQKRLLVDQAVSMVNSIAHQINYALLQEITFQVIKEGEYFTIDKDSMKFEKIDNTVVNFLNNYKEIIKIKIFDRKGVTIYSSSHENIGAINNSIHFRRALDNYISSELTRQLHPLRSDTTEKGRLYKIDLLEVYVPINKKREHGDNQSINPRNIIGVFEIYYNMSPLFSTIEKESYKISLMVMLAMFGFFLFFQILLRRADMIIKKQNEEINKHNAELKEAHEKIKDAINEVIEHGSFDVRFQGGNLLKCWEFKNCTKTDCPSYKAEDLRCWQVSGTFCGGKVQGYFANKYGDCRKCEVYQHAFKDRINMIGESFNNMMTLLESKHSEMENLNKKLNRLIDIDPLTQIGNRRSLQKRIENIHLMSLRYNRPYSIVVCDVDQFKLYNDTYGHQKGDYVLISIANALSASIRKTDEIFRWGGEEFVIILPEQDLSSALKAAEHLRVSVESLQMEHKDSNYKIVTISAGVASNIAENIKSISWETVLKQADDELYRAKLAGRNCISPPIIVKDEVVSQKRHP